jgi:hypothetical protein
VIFVVGCHGDFGIEADGGSWALLRIRPSFIYTLLMIANWYVLTTVYSARDGTSVFCNPC